MFDLKSWAPDEWHQFIQGGEDGHELNLMVTPDDLPHSLRGGRSVGTDVYFELPNSKIIQVVGSDSAGTLLNELGLARLTMRRPLRLNNIRSLSAQRGTTLPQSGVLVIWILQ